MDAAVLRQGEAELGAEGLIGLAPEGMVELAAVFDIVNTVFEELGRERASFPKRSAVLEAFLDHVAGVLKGDDGEASRRERVAVEDEGVGDAAIVDTPDFEPVEVEKRGGISPAVVEGLDERGVSEPGGDGRVTVQGPREEASVDGNLMGPERVDA